MKQTILLICLTMCSSFFAQTKGVYFTQADCESNKIDTSLNCKTWNDQVLHCKKGSETIIYPLKDIYGFVNENGLFFRCDEKLGVLQEYTSGKISVYASFRFDFKKDAEAVVQSSYVSIGRTGELNRATKKRLEEILKNDPDIWEQYLKDKNILSIIKIFNSRHK